MSPDDENKVLSQNDIDALVSAKADTAEPVPAPTAEPTSAPEADDSAVPAPAAEPAPAPEAGPPPPPAAVSVAPTAGPPPASVAEPAPAPAEPGPAPSTGGDLAQRVQRLEEELSTGGSSKLLQAHVSSLVDEVQALNKRIEGILEHLQGTVGYGLRRVFECESCNATGAVAGRIKCTHCDKESWWGWWPER